MTKTRSQKKQAQCLPAPAVPADVSQPVQSDVDGIRKLDRSRPFGNISPPYFGARGKEHRAAFFEQGGRLFDLEDREIIPGQALKSAVTVEPKTDELRRLDRSLPFGTLSPPWLGDRGELPQPAFFEQQQDGRHRFFDRHDCEVRPGKSAVKPAPPPAQELAPNGRRPASDWQAINSVAELFQRADELLDSQLQQRATTIFDALNKPCPPTRAGIMQALMVTLGYSAQYAENWHSHRENHQQKHT
jgi:hypothetical protein